MTMIQTAIWKNQDVNEIDTCVLSQKCREIHENENNKHMF